MPAVARLYDQIHPDTYTLKLHTNLSKSTFSAEEEVAFELVSDSSVLIWHGVGLEISSAMLDGDDVTWTVHPEDSTVSFTSPSPVSAGQHTLSVRFNGHVQDSLHGFYRSSYDLDGETATLAVTQFEAIHAREGLVCIDEPIAKAVFNLEITADSSLSILANTPASSRAENGNMQTVIFEPSPKMSTYLLAYIVGDLESVETKTSSGVQIRAFATPGQTSQLAFALDVARRSLEYYESYFGIAYPLPKLDMVAIPDFGAGAMENWGLVTYRETDLLIDDEKSSLANRQRVAIVVAHELAHQWFGNLVTMSWWNDLWLNESFASWAESKTIEHLFPEWDNWQDFVTSYGAYARELDSNSHTHPVEVEVLDPAGIDEIFDAISYYKGQSLLVMLEGYIGEDAFQRGLHTYLSKNAYGNAVTTDLWQAFEDASGLAVAQLMAAWTGQPGYPVVSTKVENDCVTLSQTRFLSTGPTALESDWQIPVTSTSGVTSNERVLMSPDGSIPRGNEMMKLNSDQRGFYRVSYDSKLMSSLIEGIGTLTPVDRYGLMSDQFALAEAGYITADTALSLLPAISECQDYPTWMAALSGLGSIIELFDEASDVKQRLMAFGADLTSQVADKLGWNVASSEPASRQLLRVQILMAAGIYGNQEVIRQAKSAFAQRSTAPVLPDLEGVVYGLTARYGDTAEFDQLLAAYQQSTQPQQQSRLRSALTRFTQPALITRALEFAMSEAVRPQDTILVLGQIMSRPDSSQMGWEFMTSQWEELSRRYSDGGHMLERLPEYAGDGFATEQAATMVEEFFLQNHPLVATARPARQAVERIRAKAAYRARDEERIRAWTSSL